MSEINYSKKQIGPLVKKYGIDTENDKVFSEIINMFDSVSYQIWALKLVFEGIASIDEINSIKEWAGTHSSFINKLSKKNITAYKIPSEIHQLFSEMEAFDSISFVKNCINSFNTHQKKLIANAIHIDNLTAVNLNRNAIFTSWYNLFKKFEKLPFNRKSKFISLCSAFEDARSIKEGLENAVKQSYSWNHDDMLAFMNNNATDCSVIYDNNNIVVLQVPTFKSSQALCGGGRTGWCITRESRYFDSYVTSHEDSKHTQYFLFNFNKPESDELAHVGITVDAKTGICNAHSTKNIALVGDKISYHGKRIDIYDVLEMFNIKLSNLISIKKNSYFDWNKQSFMSFIKGNNDVVVVYENGSKVIVKMNNLNKCKMLIGNTSISCDSIYSSHEYNWYFFFDFDANYTDDNSIVALGAKLDMYNIETLTHAYNIFGRDMINNGILGKIGIKLSDFISNKDILPEIMLHKCINNNDTEGALEVIRTNPNLDVNYSLRGVLPIFCAINKNMFDVFVAIVNAKNFDNSITDGFGEPVLTSMIYAYASTDTSDGDAIHSLGEMIRYLLGKDDFYLNQKDINLDTAVNVAVEDYSTMWIAEELVNNPNVNINVINDYDRSALGNAIASNNLDAIKLLSKRDDLVVRSQDIKLANSKGIDLNNYIDLSKKDISVETVKKTGDSLAYSELLKMVMASLSD